MSWSVLLKSNEKSEPIIPTLDRVFYVTAAYQQSLSLFGLTSLMLKQGDGIGRYELSRYRDMFSPCFGFLMSMQVLNPAS